MSPTVDACTIVSNNYLPFARVFARSLTKRHPGARIWVAIVDRPDPDIRYGEEPFEVVFAEELDIPNFPSFAFRYSILELNTAVKPYLLEHLHRAHGSDRLCYFDPDILITGDLSPLYEELQRQQVVLTPHILKPIADHHNPSERDFLLSGIYNLGFVGVHFQEGTLDFVRWWQERLFDFCEHRVDQGLFVDQRWMDLAPALLDAAKIIRDPGYNVAYWNLAHRILEARGNGTYEVDGKPLRFFHFSGFDWRNPKQISKYQDRFKLEDRPDLSALFEYYRQQLLEEGIDEAGSYPYGYAKFDNSVPIPSVVRKMVHRFDKRGLRWPDPFATRGKHSLFRWLCEPVRSEGPDLPRLALVMWDFRADLQSAFPSPTGSDARNFAAWFTEEVSRRPGLSPRFLEQVEATSAVSPPILNEPSSAPGAPPVYREALQSIIARKTDKSLRLHPRLLDWLNNDAGHQRRRRPRLSRLALHIWQDRRDLQGRFPDPLNEDRMAYVRWFVTYGWIEYRLPFSLIRPVLWTFRLQALLRAVAWRLRYGRRPSRPPEPEVEESPDSAYRSRQLVSTDGDTEDLEVAVVGWIGSRTGVGEASRASLAALASASVPHTTWNLPHPALDGQTPAAPDSQMIPRNIALYHVNADMMAWVHNQLPLCYRQGLYRIGYWFWELSYFPLHFADSFRYVDEVWAPSEFCKRAYETISPVPVRKVPPAVRWSKVKKVSRSDLGLPTDAFIFGFIFDALSVPERKNPFGLLEAFAEVVATCDTPVHLLLKVNHSHKSPELMANLFKRIGNLPVTVLERSLPRDELSGLLATCSAYVSLHRSEGLGLPLIESIYLGRPVIATAYGGCTDFLDQTTGWPVSYELVALDESAGPYPAGAVWADPDLSDAAEQMRQVIQAPDEVARRSSAARKRILNLYGVEAAGCRFRRELERVGSEIQGKQVVSTASLPSDTATR